jgi:hypothetical protein
MVLVSDKPSNNISILQTKFSDREGHETRRTRLEALPLDQHIEGGHGEREARLKIRLAPETVVELPGFGMAPVRHLSYSADPIM